MVVVLHLTGFAIVVAFEVVLWRCAWHVGFNEAVRRWTEAGQPRRINLGCALPPKGWFCSRVPGHDGPCAALPTDS